MRKTTLSMVSGCGLRETLNGEFRGDCGLTRQQVKDHLEIEVRYHMRSDVQGHGFATEAPNACKELARDVLHAKKLVAIIHPEHLASRRVAEKLGMARVEDDFGGAVAVRTVLGMGSDKGRS